ncbi:MAG: hypothetical protein Q8911_15160, partial [Bacillota bacterium]|nr:hypothetical protein [Bacillota bacterium]
MTKVGLDFRHIATCDANSSNVDPNGWNPVVRLQRYKTREDYLVRDSPLACLPGDDLRFQGP